MKTIISIKNNNRLEQTTELRPCQKTNGQSLCASVQFKQGEAISAFGSKEIREEPNYLTVQMSEDKHIMLDPERLQYINHSCEPNVFFDTERMETVALRDISAGEALSFFYPSTEWSMDRGFECVCNSEDCLTQIQGASHIPQTILQKYRVSPYIKQKLSSAVNNH